MTAALHNVCENTAQTPRALVRGSGADLAVQELVKARGGG